MTEQAPEAIAAACLGREPAGRPRVLVIAQDDLGLEWRCTERDLGEIRGLMYRAGIQLEED